MNDAATATSAAEHWLADFAAALESGDIDSTLGLFAEDCYWRDLLTFTWNIKTMEGKAAIREMLDATLAYTAPADWSLQEETTTEDGITEVWFVFNTALARGRGLLRLRGGKGWTLLTSMTVLRGYEEKTGPTRIQGVVHQAERGRRSWAEKRDAEIDQFGRSQQPYCLIIGGGQGGIALAARLRQLQVPALIVEKNKRPGDSWRNRYESLVLHDPVWYDHMPYLPFPEHWPVFTPKDQFGDWLEMYTKVMELNYWSDTECTHAAFDSEKKGWQVTVRRGDGETLSLQPKQLVFATGAYGFARIPKFPGADRFQGISLHTNDYCNGKPFSGKKCLVIGSASSAHDVCVDLWEHGADVTMIQRSPTIVIRSETLMDVAFAPLYSEAAVANGISTEKADLIFASLPFSLMAQGQIPLYEEIARIDKDYYERLAASGFQLTMGPDQSGLMMQALRTASGYYIDVGASELIAKGEIKLKAGVDIDHMTATGIAFRDGSALDGDVIIYATGYGSMDEMVAHLISEAAAEKVGKFWGYGSGIPGDPGPWEGELRNMWKPTRHEALWFHGGNLALSRFYSLHVALQIKARMHNLPTPVYGLSET